MQGSQLAKSVTTAIVAVVLIGPGCAANSGTGEMAGGQTEVTRAISGGGIFVQGWSGRIDDGEVEAGLTLEDARLAMEGDAMRVTTGPAVTYWSPTNQAAGEYTVRATFTEPSFMNLNDHPHPYGIVVGGNDLGTEQQSYLYCSAYGDGTFIVRGFGPDAFRLSPSRPEASPAVNRAAAPNAPVTQEIAVSVRADRVDCSINGAVVGSYPRSEVVASGRLRSTDGLYGVRFGHNTEGLVRGLTVTRP